MSIYKIVCNTTNDVYYGSTTLSIETRLKLHLKDYNRYLLGKTTNKTTSFEILKNNNYSIIEVEKVGKDNLLERENFYITNFECVNKNAPCPTPELKKISRTNTVKKYNNSVKGKKNTKKYSQTEKNKEYKKQYKNTDIYINYRKKKYHCICGSELLLTNKPTHDKSKKHFKLLEKINSTERKV
jgi:hypothetical protein